MKEDITPGKGRLAKDAFARCLDMEIKEKSYALADVVFAADCNSHGTLSIGLNVNIYSIKVNAGGTVRSGKNGEESRTGKTGVYPMEIRGKNSDPAVLAKGLAYSPGEAVEV